MWNIRYNPDDETIRRAWMGKNATFNARAHLTQSWEMSRAAKAALLALAFAAGFALTLLYFHASAEAKGQCIKTYSENILTVGPCSMSAEEVHQSWAASPRLPFRELGSVPAQPKKPKSRKNKKNDD